MTALLLPGGRGAEWTAGPPLLPGGLLCEPWPPREGGPAALEECPQIFDKILNDPIVIFRGLGEDDS